jgi:hypothetical protein
LVERARQLQLALPVLDALQQCQRVYNTTVPEPVGDELSRCAASPWPRSWRAWLFDHALRPAHASAFGRSTRLAHGAIFVRSHWLRMPLPLLVRHVSHKLFIAD